MTNKENDNQENYNQDNNNEDNNNEDNNNEDNNNEDNNKEDNNNDESNNELYDSENNGNWVRHAKCPWSSSNIFTLWKIPTHMTPMTYLLLGEKSVNHECPRRAITPSVQMCPRTIDQQSRTNKDPRGRLSPTWVANPEQGRPAEDAEANMGRKWPLTDSHLDL